MAGKIVVIVNPAARRGEIGEGIARRTLSELGVPFEIHRTTGPGHAGQLALETAGRDAGETSLMVLGGDGTVVEVAGALAGSDRAIGVIPGGTGNQLARFLRLPLSISRSVRELVASDRSRVLDMARFNGGRHFAIAAGLGMDAAMIAGTSGEAKRRFGVAAYIYSATKAVLRPEIFGVRINADGKLFEREGGLAMIANVGEVMGGRFSLGPQISPDDGWLDICVLSPSGVIDGARIATMMARGNFTDESRMFFVRARSASIEADAGVPAQADGELLDGSSIVADIVAGSARFMVR